MVVIEEVQDEEQQQQQQARAQAAAGSRRAAGAGAGAAGFAQEGDWKTDDGESTDSERDAEEEDEEDDDDDDDDDDLSKETFLDRLSALKDIVPPQTRRSISSAVSTTTNLAWFGGRIVGTLGWVVTTSALVVALPLMLAVEDEARIMQQEREMPPQGMIGAPGGLPQPQPGQPQQPGQPGQAVPGATTPSGIRAPGF
ncbi:mitochondrial import receptor subunit Tom22 [Tilletia horrida]|nr:mitochondrial import receptor subunit Tom22 [Tilletia horrida]